MGFENIPLEAAAPSKYDSTRIRFMIHTT